MIALLRAGLTLASSLAILAMTLAACASAPPETIEVADLTDLILSAEEAPAGTEFYQGPSGEQQIDTLTQNVRTANAETGGLKFMGGYGTFFVSSGFDPFGSGASPPPDAMLIGNAAFAFADADNASEALRIHRELVVPSVTTGTVRIEVDELGEEAHAFTFDRALIPAQGAIYAFRVANVVFVVAGSGESLSPSELLDIARTIADRTQAG